MTRLYQKLLVRLMPFSLLDAMHFVYEECADSCCSQVGPPFVHPIETIGNWLQLASQTSSTPPSPAPYDDFELSLLEIEHQ